MFDAKDVTFIDGVLAEIGSATEKSGVVFTPGTVSYSGTNAEAGNPPSVTFGTRSASMRVQRVNMKQVERADGRYMQDDQSFSVRGSFSSNDLLSVEAGTFRPIDGPWKFFMGSNLYWQSVCREVK